MHDHEALIERLSLSAKPVRRPWSPAARALLVAIIGLASGWLVTSNIRSPWAALNGGDNWGLAQFILTIVAGISALVAAFQVSIPGIRSRWQWVPGVILLTWLFACLGGIFLSGEDAGTLGDGIYCFRFLTVASLPMIVAVVIALRRTRSPNPTRTLLYAGVGVAALSVSLLALCHPFSLQLVDFGMHLSAIVCVVGLTVLIGRPQITYPPMQVRSC